MVKSDEYVIRDFNETVNMTADELQKWLKGSNSKDSGWAKGDESGDSVGYESGRKIIQILRNNPKKDLKKYSKVDIVRRVAAHNKRHLAQEETPRKTRIQTATGT